MNVVVVSVKAVVKVKVTLEEAMKIQVVGRIVALLFL
jgi:hypothetical protein